VRAALALAAVLAVAAPARLDATFGQGGEAKVDLGGSEVAEAMLLQHDGKVVVAGSSTSGTSPAFLVRLKADGKPDLRLTRDDVGVDQIPALAQQPNGKLLVAWQTLTTRGETVIYHVRLERLNTDGSLDFSVDLFNGGAAGLQGGGPAGAQAIAVQPDEKIVVLLATTLIRLNADGSPDLRVDFGPTDVARALALEPDGRILVAGTRGGGPYVDAYRADGSLDPDFHAALESGSPQSLAVLPGGRIVVATRTQVERLLPTGASETTGAIPGPAIALDPQGRLVAAGPGGVGRLTATLAPDNSFGGAGTAGLGNVDPVAVALQPDGKVLVAGTAGSDAVVLRLPANAPIRLPAVRLTHHPAAVVRAHARVVFAFRSDTAKATFRCARDSGPFRPCHSPVAYRPAPGAHRFRVQALGGGVTGPSVSFRFRVAGST
jgi:uncharacterized delta-60 repeat protein